MSVPPDPFVIDADGHVIEPAEAWKESLEAPYRDRAPRPVTETTVDSAFGWPIP